MNYFIWVWLLLIFILPFWQQRRIIQQRLLLMRHFEQQRGSRLITLIHRQESLSLLGIAFSRYIDIDDSEQVLRAIRLTPNDMPIDIILHTPGGLVLAAEQIASALSKHEGKVTVFVPHYAMSGGTMIALAADEILMDRNAVLGPMDPQIGQLPAASILKVLERKQINEIDDQTIIMADIAVKAIKQVRDLVRGLLEVKHSQDAASDIADELTSGRWTHDFPLTCNELSRIGITVCAELPPEVYQLMDLYPQRPGRRPSAEYIPLPYHNRPRN